MRSERCFYVRILLFFHTCAGLSSSLEMSIYEHYKSAQFTRCYVIFRYSPTGIALRECNVSVMTIRRSVYVCPSDSAKISVTDLPGCTFVGHECREVVDACQ